MPVDASDVVTVILDGRSVRVRQGTTVAAALMNLGNGTMRTSVSGDPRGPLCGMGVCFECRVVVDGLAQRLACQTLCVDGMEVRTDAG